MNEVKKEVRDTKLVVNVWTKGWEDDDSYDPESKLMEYTDSYPNMSGPSMNDGYIQFGVTLDNGDWLEVRVPDGILQELMDIMEVTQDNWE